jgi:hypothetical protein
MVFRTLIGLSGFCVAIPLLVGWAKWRVWELRRDRGL